MKQVGFLYSCLNDFNTQEKPKEPAMLYLEKLIAPPLFILSYAPHFGK